MFFVQFPHPGGEHRADGPAMNWNTGEHRRKFLVGPGRYLDAADQVREAELVFWGEWEPPSSVVVSWPASGLLPRALHRPNWSRPSGDGYRQNTDPWVFGDQMLYSNCKQTGDGGRRRTAMQSLTRGSVVCFGSTRSGSFCLDTVLVVSSAEPWDPADAERCKTGEAFLTCTAGALTTGGGCGAGDAGLTLYRGATLDDTVDGMYSFVPAQRADSPRRRFARPAVHLPGLINPASTQSPWGSLRPMRASDVRDAWEAIRHQVLAAGLLLAVHLDTPPELGKPVSIPVTDRTRC